jgi:glycosyltransferase involved in cell wall biosynthesis
MSAKLTVIIPCKNEREHIAACIRSALQVADEVLLADSGSTDGTIEIARDLGCRIVQREYRTSGDFKNWAIPQATHPWVFILDADERITPALAAEMRKTLDDPHKNGYEVVRLNHFMGHPIHFGPWRNDRLIRLFRRDVCRYIGATDHAIIEMPKDKFGRLRSPLTHYTCESYAQYLPKLSRYAEVQARLWLERGRKAKLLPLFARFPLRFLQGYILQGGFLNGRAGLQVCAMVAYQSWLKQALFWQMQCGRSWRSSDPFEQPVTEPIEAADSNDRVIHFRMRRPAVVEQHI